MAEHYTHYEMQCGNCDETTNAYRSKDDYVCMMCGYTTDAEAGGVVDIDGANDAYAQYRGMKQAGFFKEKWAQEEEKQIELEH